jgi:hypothetical protein
LASPSSGAFFGAAASAFLPLPPAFFGSASSVAFSVSSAFSGSSAFAFGAAASAFFPLPPAFFASESSVAFCSSAFFGAAASAFLPLPPAFLASVPFCEAAFSVAGGFSAFLAEALVSYEEMCAEKCSLQLHYFINKLHNIYIYYIIKSTINQPFASNCPSNI